MPDTTIPFDTLSSQSDASQAQLVTAAYMRGLWTAYEVARDAYSEADEERTGAAVSDAQQRILAARTIDPESNAIKLKVIAERADCSPGLLGNIIEDLGQSQRAPSLVDFCRAVSKAARPHTEEGGGIKSNIGLADALVPLIGSYTIAEATCAIAVLHAAFQALGGENGDDPMFSTLMLLEDFVSRADAADADSITARAYIIERSAAGDDGWDLGPENMAAATRHAANEARKLRAGRLPTPRRGTFEAFASDPLWRSEADKHLEAELAAAE